MSVSQNIIDQINAEYKPEILVGDVFPMGHLGFVRVRDVDGDWVTCSCRGNWPLLMHRASFQGWMSMRESVLLWCKS